MFVLLIREHLRSTLFPYTTLFRSDQAMRRLQAVNAAERRRPDGGAAGLAAQRQRLHRSEEHTSELQSRQYLVCRLLLEKKNDKPAYDYYTHKQLITVVVLHVYPFL